jgi:Protein of unknown function, DUF481
VRLRLLTRIWVLTLVFFLCRDGFAKFTDDIVMSNGNHLTGRIKKMEYGVLYIETEYWTGSVGVDWLRVNTIKSRAQFQITFKNGTRVNGTIEKRFKGKTSGSDFSVRTDRDVVHAFSGDVVEIQSQKTSFWRQLTGSIDFGASYTSGNNQAAVNSSADASYLSTRWFGGGSFTSSLSGQSGGSETNLLHGQSLDGLFLNQNSFLLGLLDLLHSSQQDLNLRTTAGTGYGRYWIRTNRTFLLWLTGVVYTHENYFPSTGQPIKNNCEAVLGAQYQLFRFARYRLQSQLLTYPGLTDIGRVRVTTKTIFNLKLTNNFYASVSFWDNFDSRPPFNAKGNELGISNSIGWTF